MTAGQRLGIGRYMHDDVVARWAEQTVVASLAGPPRPRPVVGQVRRRRPEVDPLADVPEPLRVFPPGWLEVAAQGPDGYAEARAAADDWLDGRREWREQHGYRGSVLEWLQADAHVRGRVWRASEVWRPSGEQWMTRGRDVRAEASPYLRGKE